MEVGFLRRPLLLIAAFLIYWLAASGALWRLYDIGPLITGGYFKHDQAISAVTKMGLLVTLLTSTAWLWSMWAVRRRTLLGIWWGAASRTLLILFLYWFAVFLRRQIWKPSQGVNDDAMFLPFVGHINAVFFAELGWLLFLVGVIPCMGLFSGFLFFFEERFARKANINSPG